MVNRANVKDETLQRVEINNWVVTVLGGNCGLAHKSAISVMRFFLDKCTS